MSDWEEARSRLGYRSKAMLTSGADKWDQQTGADIQAMLDLVRVQDEANREMTRLLAQSKAALLDAQHQEAQDIEALSRLEDERDTLRIDLQTADDQLRALRLLTSPTDYDMYLKVREDALREGKAERDALRADVERLERARLRSADWLTFEKMEAEVERLREIMRRLVHGIDEWNASVEPIIGRPVDYKWLALEEARAALTPAEEGWGYDTETGEEGKS